MHRWAESYGAALTCLAITHRELVYTVDPAVWGALPHDYASIAAWNLGLYHEALKHAKNAVDLAPDDMRLRQNLAFCEQRIAEQSAA
jgi:Flp pilus assembly protein TadD